MSKLGFILDIPNNRVAISALRVWGQLVNLDGKHGHRHHAVPEGPSDWIKSCRIHVDWQGSDFSFNECQPVDVELQQVICHQLQQDLPPIPQQWLASKQPWSQHLDPMDLGNSAVEAWRSLMVKWFRFQRKVWIQMATAWRMGMVPDHAFEKPSSSSTTTRLATSASTVKAPKANSPIVMPTADQNPCLHPTFQRYGNAWEVHQMSSMLPRWKWNDKQGEWKLDGFLLQTIAAATCALDSNGWSLGPAVNQLSNTGGSTNSDLRLHADAGTYDNPWTKTSSSTSQTRSRPPRWHLRLQGMERWQQKHWQISTWWWINGRGNHQRTSDLPAGRRKRLTGNIMKNVKVLDQEIALVNYATIPQSITRWTWWSSTAVLHCLQLWLLPMVWPLWQSFDKNDGYDLNNPQVRLICEQAQLRFQPLCSSLVCHALSGAYSMRTSTIPRGCMCFRPSRRWTWWHEVVRQKVRHTAWDGQLLHVREPPEEQTLGRTRSRRIVQPPRQLCGAVWCWSFWWKRFWRPTDPQDLQGSD